MIYINHINNARNRGIARELREAIKISKLEFALEPYREYLNLPEIDYFRKKGQLETTLTRITIRHCSLILAFGIKKLIDDIDSNTLVPGFEMAMEEDYRVVQPTIKLLSYKNRRHQQEYDDLRKKHFPFKRSIHKLYNSTIFLKYNAIRYFYHVNSYHRDLQEDNDQVIEGTDMNVIYKEQIDDGIESTYSTQVNGRKVYKIIHGTSMIEL